MRKVRFQKTYILSGRQYAAGTVAGLKDSKAMQAVLSGAAVYVSDDVRALKYAPTAKVAVECVQPDEEPDMEEKQVKKPTAALFKNK